MSHYSSMRKLDDRFRPHADEYRTPVWCVDALARVFRIPRSTYIWDPSAGSELWTVGTHLRDCWEWDPWRVRLSELRGNIHHGLPRGDFLEMKRLPGFDCWEWDRRRPEFAIFTNPPYGCLLEEFLAHAWRLGAKFVGFFLPVVWLYAEGLQRGRSRNFRQTNLRFQINCAPRVAFEISEQQAHLRIIWNAFLTGKKSKLFQEWGFTDRDIEDRFGGYEPQPGDKPENVIWRAGAWYGGTPSGGYCWAIWERGYTGSFSGLFEFDPNKDFED